MRTNRVTLRCAALALVGSWAQATVQDSSSLESSPFRPYDSPALGLINGIQFTPGGEHVLFTLLQENYLRHTEGSLDGVLGEVGLFQAPVTKDGWGPPVQLPFSGTYQDYEPALTPDGRWLVFNSRRPDAEGVIPELNDLWIARRDDGPSGIVWGEPRRIDELCSDANEESYATLANDGSMIFHKRSEVEGTPRSDLWISRLDERGHFGTARLLEGVSSEFGESDPLIAPDGSYLLFTRWDEELGWEASCDIYVTFRTEYGWSDPLPFEELNSARADYSPSFGADAASLYSRVGGRFQQRPLAPALARARERAQV